MEHNLKPIQALFLWRLLADGGEAWQKDLKPKLDAKVRKELEAIGLIKVEPQANKRRANYVVLLDQGWHWAEQHLDHELPATGTSALFILRNIMTRIKQRVSQGEFSLADFFSPAAPTTVESISPPTSQADHDHSDLKRRIIAACQNLSAGAHSGRIRLADLRSSLADITRNEMDQTLRELEISQRIVVSPLDNPREIGPRDEEAALSNSSNDPRHIVYLQTTG